MLSTDRRGFVLLEAVIALVIISLFAVALLTTVGAQVRTADRGVVLLTGRALAEDRFMAIQMLTYDELQDFPPALASGVFPEPFGDYSWTATVEEVPEPVTFLLLASGLAGTAIYRRRKIRR